MQVKVYREKETESLILDEAQNQRYHELMQSLGLEKQKENQEVPSVYTALNHAMQLQLTAICPAKTKAENYNKSTIPLEVLEVMDFCIQKKMYDGYEIWYNDVQPDPLLIGFNYQDEDARKSGYSWRRNFFLIARWGDCALELKDLLELGRKNMIQTFKTKTVLAKEKIDSMVKNPEIYIDLVLAGKSHQATIDLSIE